MRSCNGYTTCFFFRCIVDLVVSNWLINCAWHFLSQLANGELDFDGENWYFADHVGTVSVRFDGQTCLLLRFESEFKQVTWLWADAGFELGRWLDLRRAVYSRPAMQNSLDLI